MGSLKGSLEGFPEGAGRVVFRVQGLGFRGSGFRV